MLTNLTVRNFKRFQDASIELSSPVVLIGPNDSGKTTALQALALWEIGLRRWLEKRSGKEAPQKRPGVTINRRDLIAVPVPYANLLWRDLHVRDVKRIEGKQSTKNVLVEILVEGVTDGKSWSCGLEFDYANDESFYCRPMRLDGHDEKARMIVPPEAAGIRVAFLPPMSGLASRENRLDIGAVNVLLGEGRTAEVLRNLCYIMSTVEKGDEKWVNLRARIRGLFGVELELPEYIEERGEVSMAYRSRSGVRLDLSSSGRGMQQTLLLLSYLVVNPRSVLLLDEPDAHLEILRQRQVYHVLNEAALEQGCQIIAASHSEIVLAEAAQTATVVAFVGEPHRIDDRGHQVLKSLAEIGFDQYYQAERAGWVLYLEGPTDLAILRALAVTADHGARTALDRPFVRYVRNNPSDAKRHFFELREAKRDLVGFALFDRLERALDESPPLEQRMWRRREIENYLCTPKTLMRYAETSAAEHVPGPLFVAAEAERRQLVMERCIRDSVAPAALRDPNHRWWHDTKASDDFLDGLFRDFFKQLGLPNLMSKSNFHVLARHVAPHNIDPEVIEVLDQIDTVARLARPGVDDG